MPLSSIVCQVSPLSIVFLPSPTFVLFHFSFLLLLLFSYDYFPFNYLDFLFLIFGWVGCCLIDIEMLFSVQTNEPKPNRDEISGAVRLSFCSCLDQLRIEKISTRLIEFGFGLSWNQPNPTCALPSNYFTLTTYKFYINFRSLLSHYNINKLWHHRINHNINS